MHVTDRVCDWYFWPDTSFFFFFLSKCQLFQWNDWKSLDLSNNFVLKPCYFHTMDCKLAFISTLNSQLSDQASEKKFHSYLCHNMEEIIFLYIVTLNSDLFLKQSHCFVCLLETWKSMSMDHFLIPLWCFLDPLIWRWVNDNLPFLVNYSFNPNRIYFPFGSNRRLATVNPSVQYLSNV